MGSSGEQIAGDVAASLIGAWAGYSLTSSLTQHTATQIAGLMAGGAVGGFTSAYLQGRLSTSTDPTIEWIEQNPLTYMALSGACTGVTFLLGDLFFPEFVLLPGVSTLWRLVAFTSGLVGGAFIGPTIGEEVQIVLYLAGKVVGLDLPEPSAIANALSMKELPKIIGDGLRDMFTHAFWYDSLKPIMDAAEKGNVAGVVQAAWFSAPRGVWGGINQILSHAVKASGSLARALLSI